MKLYREQIKQSDGTIRKSDAWYIEWRDHKRVRRRWAGYKDKRASSEFGHWLEQLADTVASGASLTETQSTRIDRLQHATRKRLSQIGMLGGGAPQSGGSLGRHLDDFKGHLRAKNRTPKYIQACIASCRTIFAATDSVTASDVTGDNVELALHALRDGGLSIAGSNRHLQHVRSFFSWMRKARKIDRNPLDIVTTLNEATDRRHPRGTFTAKELARLLAIVEDEPDKYWLYRIASETGLRVNELRQLRIKDFALGLSPTITVLAGYSKARRTDVLPIRRNTAKGLKAYFHGRKSSDRAFVVPQKPARTLRSDMARAKIPYQSKGLYRDFHALRHTFGTLAGRGVESFADLQALMRHATPAMTARYAHSDSKAMRRAVERLG